MDKGSWEFKYAPKSFRKDSFILPDEVRNQLLEVIRGRWKENLLLSGTAGTGKTSVCKILKENSQDFEIIDCAQYKSNSNWQAEGKGYNKVIRNTVNLTTIAEGLDNKKKIQRLVILEEFDEIVSQSLFKTILSDTTDTLFSLKPLIMFYKNSQHKEQFFTNPKFFDLLVGNDLLIEQIKNGVSIEEIKLSWEPQLQEYLVLRSKYLLYPDFD